MSKKYKGRIEGPFVALLKDTIKTEAWKALSHGARSLYVALRSRYNLTTQNAVYVSTRNAEEELGRHSNRHNVLLWFRELEHYGFIVEVSPAHHGVNGHGKAPHYRLTEAWYLGKAPTRDYLAWDGSPFTDKRKRDTPMFPTIKNRIRGDHGVTILVTTGEPLVPEIVSAAAESGDHGVAMSDQTGGDHGVAITSLTTPYADPDLLSAFEAMWSCPPIAIPFRGLRLMRLFQRPAKRPDKRAEAAYFAAWYQIEQQDCAAAAAPCGALGESHTSSEPAPRGHSGAEKTEMPNHPNRLQFGLGFIENTKRIASISVTGFEDEMERRNAASMYTLHAREA
jgi:hypothetical protein